MTRTPIPTRLIPDYELYELCQVLANEQYQPTAIHVLYFLLQPIIQHSVQRAEDIGPALRRAHGDSIQVMTFGEVPTLAQLDSEKKEVVEKVWGVAMLWTYEPENSGSRGRFWISSETRIVPASSSSSTHASEKDDGHWQPDNQSIHLLQTMCDTFFRPFLAKQQRNGSPSSIFFHGTNQCWTPTLATSGRKTYDGLCTKAARVVSLVGGSAEEVVCPKGFRIRPLQEKDIQIVIDSNKIKFPPEYVRSRQYLSVAIVNSETDELASWAMTHADCALHTASSYRRLGLGSLVVSELADVVRTHLAANALTSGLLRNGTFRMHAECEAYNSVTMQWFCGLGYEKVVDNTWVMIEFQ
ncbi:hypothetical protein QFC21_001994 [Naganishia friedmannii]|uniref:Uncharacterized protein n=1 Tax=Naganishia friedmannii TaxID=89922 RepID=A0ACC2VYM7_9TREE|nr:hypothetical protein QFC21_001994 [Naganishia friedmannii]